MALVSGRYATALFGLALERNCVDRFYEDVCLVKEVISENKELTAVLNHPQVTCDEKINILVNSFSDSVDKDILGFFSVVFRKNRGKELKEILSAFIKKAEDYKGIAYATVESAEALEGSTLERIEKQLSKNLNKQVKAEAKVVPELLGGLKITVCGKVIDSSISSQIQRLKKQLLTGPAK